MLFSSFIFLRHPARTSVLQHRSSLTTLVAPVLAHDVLDIVPDNANHTATPATACFVHGLLGQGRNWRSFARRAVEPAAHATARPWRVLLLDLRNHGESSTVPGLHAPHTLATAAEDVAHTLRHVLGGAPDILLGHSLGGKVVLETLRQCGDLAAHDALQTPPRLAFVLDSDPGTLPLDAERDVDSVLKQVERIPLPVPSRQWLLDHMQAKGFSMGLAQWLGSNLVSRSGGLHWAFRIEGAAALYNSYRVTDMWGTVRAPPLGCQLHMVIAERSAKHNPAMMSALHGAQAAAAANGRDVQVHVLPDAGHWLHADNPSGLAALLLPWLVHAGSTT